MRYIVFIWLLAWQINANAQTANVDVGLTMPSVALVDLLPSGAAAVSLQMKPPAEAGSAVSTGTANSTQWLIFSSAVTTGGSRSIKGDVIGTLPPGIRLKLVVSPYIGNGLGFTGGSSYVTGNNYLTNTPVSFISNIKGAYTGTGYGTHGFKLTYSLEIQNYAEIRSGKSTVTVRYTISDN